MIVNESKPSTKDRILDTAEFVYAELGTDGLTLRTIAEAASVNLAAINYHFRSKDNLTSEMLSRCISPLQSERLALLDQYQRLVGKPLSAAHIVSAILLPSISRLAPASPESHMPHFFLRTAADPTPSIRDTLQKQFQGVTDVFDQAFINAFPERAPHEVLWRVHTLFNAAAGTVANQNTMVMLRDALAMPNLSVERIIWQFTNILCAPEWTGTESSVLWEQIVTMLRAHGSAVALNRANLTQQSM